MRCGPNAVFLFMMIDVTHTHGRLTETASGQANLLIGLRQAAGTNEIAIF